LLDERMTDVLERLASRQQANPETPLEKKVVSLVSKYFHEPLSPLELKVLFPAFKVAEFA